MLPNMPMVGVTCDSDSASASYARVIQIYLVSIDMNGTLPLSIGNFQSMSSSGLPANNIRGTIPSTIGALSSLNILQLTENSLTGTIPSTMGLLILSKYIDISPLILSLVLFLLQ